MGSFTESTTIAAPVTQVWTALADIGSIADWNPGVVASSRIDEGPVQNGSSRRCDLPAKRWLEEQVGELQEPEKITFRIVGTNLPFAAADIRFTLESAGASQTRVTVSPEYKLKYGPAGVLMDRVAVQSRYRKGMADLLAGLKARIEAPGEAQ